VGLESLAKVFGLSPRTAEKGIIHPFFLTWLNRQPSAELERDTKDGLTVYESVLEVSADELFVLHGKLCWLGSIPDRLCSDGSFFDNPIDPFLRVSKVFKVQLKYFWTVRGGALLWSNRKECLGSAFSKSGTRFAGCVDRKPSSVKSLFEHNSALRLHKALTSQQRDSYGLFVNEEQLLNALDAVVDSFGNSEKLQSEWLSDLLVQADTLRDLRNLSNSLKLRSQLIPFWGARLVENGPGSLELLTVARWNGMDEHLEKIQRDWAESQFEFLYSLKTAWSGLPRTRGRFRQSGPWRQIAEFRQSKSLFEIGWSDRE
jgi:hypothetical protein